MVVGAKVCDLTEDLLWFVCGLYVGILTSSLRKQKQCYNLGHTFENWIIIEHTVQLKFVAKHKARKLATYNPLKSLVWAQ